MLIRLQAPYADVRASDLSLALGLEPFPALETLNVELGSWAIELRLLGCSHQALLRTPDGDWSETVACRPGVAGELPASRTERAPAGTYAFTAVVEALDPERGALIADEAAADPLGLVGIFGRPEGAFTALRLHEEAAGVAWTSWHAYPQSGELVVTRSAVTR